MKDLIVLVADKNLEAAINEILNRHQALGVRQLSWTAQVHLERDAGCLNNSSGILRPYLRDHRYALVVFDQEGSGRENDQRLTVARFLADRLERDGWSDRVGVVVIAPELETWIWTPSPQLGAAIGWAGIPTLRDYLIGTGEWPEHLTKPTRPKELFEKILKKLQKPRSSSLYTKIAKSVTLAHCVDPAFLELRDLLKRWFAL